MFKIKSGECFNLPLLLLLGLSKYFLLSVLDTHLAIGQSRTYFCQSGPGQSSHRVIVSSRGERSLIIWNPGELSRCRDVANRFQSALESGNLKYLLKIGNNICGSNTDRGNIRCSTDTLVSLDGVSSESLLVRAFDGRDEIAGNYIFQSNSEAYFSWEEYLESLEQYPSREPFDPPPPGRRPLDPPPESLGR